MAPNEEQFFVHGELIAQVSNVLAAEVRGHMQEAEAGIIHIKDVDGDLDDDTVMRFVEFAYRGDYTVPRPEITSSLEIVEEQDAVEAANDFDWRVGSSSTKKKSKKKGSQNNWFAEPPYDDPPAEEADMYGLSSSHGMSKRDKLWSSFCALASVKTETAWEPALNQDPHEDHSSVILSHARLYVFSNRYECDTLRDLCLQKLRLTLSRYNLRSERHSEIIQLVRYSYNHTQEFENGSDKLRDLVSDYVVCHLELLCAQTAFPDLLPICDGLAKDVMLKSLKRLD